MAKNPKRPSAERKRRRNPFAKALGAPLYRKRVVRREGVYRRRAKHARAPGEESDA
jgi:hypothetical protein